MTGRIYTGDELTADLELECDVCVIGSGAGGAWLAHELVAAGKRVVMLEEGGYHTRREFDMTEARAFPNLYQELGNRTTDDLAISLLQGRSVGCGTTVNWCSSFRPPERILKTWREVHGIDTLSTEVLTLTLRPSSVGCTSPPGRSRPSTRTTACCGTAWAS